MRIIAILFALFLTTPASLSHADPQEVVVAVSDAPPYRIVQGNLFSGFYIDVLTQVAERLDWRITFKEAPFRRVLRMLELGDADLMLGALRTPEREQYMEFAVPVFPPERRLFFFTKAQNKILNYEDLRGKKIGVLRGSSYFPAFDNDLDLLKEAETNYDNLFRMLERGHLDVVIAPELVGLHTLKSNRINAHISPFFVPGESSYIAISKKSKLIGQAKQIQQVIDDLHDEKVYETLLLKYLDRRETVIPPMPAQNPPQTTPTGETPAH